MKERLSIYLFLVYLVSKGLICQSLVTSDFKDSSGRVWKAYQPSLVFKDSKFVIDGYLQNEDCSRPPYEPRIKYYPHAERCDYYFVISESFNYHELRKCSAGKYFKKENIYSGSCVAGSYPPNCFKNIGGCWLAVREGAKAIAQIAPRSPVISQEDVSNYFSYRNPNGPRSGTQQSKPINVNRATPQKPNDTPRSESDQPKQNNYNNQNHPQRNHGSDNQRPQIFQNQKSNDQKKKQDSDNQRGQIFHNTRTSGLNVSDEVKFSDEPLSRTKRSDKYFESFRGLWVHDPEIRYRNDKLVFNGYLYEINFEKKCVPVKKTGFYVVPDPEKCDWFYYLENYIDKHYKHRKCKDGKYFIQLELDSGVCVKGPLPKDCHKDIAGCGRASGINSRKGISHKTAEEDKFSYLNKPEKRTWSKFIRSYIQPHQRNRYDPQEYRKNQVKEGAILSSPIRGYTKTWYPYEPTVRYHKDYAIVDGFMYYRCRPPAFAAEFELYPTPDVCNLYWKINKNDVNKNKPIFCPDGEYFQAKSYKDMKCVKGPLPKDCLRVIKNMQCWASKQDHVFTHNFPINPPHYFRYSDNLNFVTHPRNDKSKNLLTYGKSYYRDYEPYFQEDSLGRKWVDYEPDYRFTNDQILIDKHIFAKNCSLPPWANKFNRYPHPEMCDHFYAFDRITKEPILKKCKHKRDQYFQIQFTATNFLDGSCRLLETRSDCYKNIRGCSESAKWGIEESIYPTKPKIPTNRVYRSEVILPVDTKDTKLKRVVYDGVEILVHPLLNQNIVPILKDTKVTCKEHVIDGLTVCRGWNYRD